MEHTAPLAPGSSGGALLDADGQARRDQHEPDRRGLLSRAAGRRRAPRRGSTRSAAASRPSASVSASPSPRRTSPSGCADRSGSRSVTACSSAASRTAAPRRRPGSRPATSSSRPADEPVTDADELFAALGALEFPFEVKLVRGHRRADRPGRRRHDGHRRGLSHARPSLPRTALDRAGHPIRTTQALDAYSVAVSTAAERLIPSVASLRVTRQVGGWSARRRRVRGGDRAGRLPRDVGPRRGRHGTGHRHVRRRRRARVPGRRSRPAVGPRRGPDDRRQPAIRRRSVTPRGCASASSSSPSATRSASPGP